MGGAQATPTPRGEGRNGRGTGRGGMGGAQANPTPRGEGRNGRGTSQPYYLRGEKGGGWVLRNGRGLYKEGEGGGYPY